MAIPCPAIITHVPSRRGAGTQGQGLPHPQARDDGGFIEEPGGGGNSQLTGPQPPEGGAKTTKALAQCSKFLPVPIRHRRINISSGFSIRVMSFEYLLPLLGVGGAGCYSFANFCSLTTISPLFIYAV